MVRDILTAASGAIEDKLYPEDAFVSYVRTGTGADVTVTTNIDMTKGYMVWTKGRSGATDHAIYDSARGVTKDLTSNTTAAETTQTTGLKAVSTTGHTIGSLAKMNTSGATYVDWVFRKAPKFLDIVTWTGNGVAGRQIPHNLGCEVGMIIVKRTSVSGDWWVWHKTQTGKTANLNRTGIFFSYTNFGTVTDTYLTLEDPVNNDTNHSGSVYVAYLFAHDPSADGIIQCGSYITDGTGKATVTLNFEPQWILAKSASSAGDDWKIIDSMRGFTVGTNSKILMPNSSSSETSTPIAPTATGFQDNGAIVANGTAIYLAIRRPNKVPTSGSAVYNAIAATGSTNTARTTNFPIDMQLISHRTATDLKHLVVDRLRGVHTVASTAVSPILATSSTSAEDNSSYAATNKWNSESFSDSAWANGSATVWHSFKRAKGFMDIVCYAGDGVAGRAVNHNLGVVPELMIVKCRNQSSTSWLVYHKELGLSKQIFLNGTWAANDGYGAYTGIDKTAFYVSSASGGAANAYTNLSGYTYIWYGFATLAGISKVGSYIGNGSSQTINCSFSTGSRFVLIKRTDASGDWYIWDSARGIVAANDPHLSLNTTAAEVTTDDSVDPESSGFIVNQNTATNINVLNGTYIFLAIA